MPKRKRFDPKSQKNRERVKKFRDFQKLKSIHEKKIFEKIHSNPVFNSEYNEQIDDSNDEAQRVDKATEIKNKLIRWAINHRITKIATNDLLSILKFAGLNFLPKDSRTLLRTDVNTPITHLSNGKMWYNGVKKCLENVLCKISSNISVTLDFNFDGAPISKSSNSQIWPILSSIRGRY